MATSLSRQDYLAHRGRLIGSIAEIEAKIRTCSEEVKHRWRLGEAADDIEAERRCHWQTKAALDSDLAALDARWHEEDAAERAASALASLPGRRDTLAKVESGLAERTRILREIESRLAPLKGLVADFEDMSDSLRALVKPLRAELGDNVQYYCQALSDRHHERQIVSGMLFAAGLWGCGSKDDYFRLQDRDLDTYERMMTNSLTSPIRAALLAEDVE